MLRNIHSKIFTIFQCLTEFHIIKVIMEVEFPADDNTRICRNLNRGQQAYPKRRKNIYQLTLHYILKYLNLFKPAVRISNSGQYQGVQVSKPCNLIAIPIFRETMLPVHARRRMNIDTVRSSERSVPIYQLNGETMRTNLTLVISLL